MVVPGNVAAAAQRGDLEYACFGSVPVWKSAELHLLQRIARLPNGPCWNVLSYWRDPEQEAE